ncbi:acyl carrier protein [Streptomyces kanamyceticus]|nr:acyl carrier protein [Streptomyces kanamyceticus]
MTDRTDVAEKAESAPFPLTDVQRSFLLGRQDGQPPGGTGCPMTLEFGHAFFDLGADSLLAMRLSLAVTERVGARVPPRRLQSDATLVGTARAIDGAPAARPADTA